jgi:hypothetical protein
VKLLFLDIDGVLNSIAYFRRRDPITAQKCRDIDPDAVMLLNEVIERTGCSVVLSSTWRLFGLDAVRETLAERGFTGTLIGATPVLSDNNPNRRGREILSWLKTSGERATVAIVDDDTDMGPLLPRLVKTSTVDGLQRGHVEELVRLLGEEPVGFGLEVIGG